MKAIASDVASRKNSGGSKDIAVFELRVLELSRYVELVWTGPSSYLRWIPLSLHSKRHTSLYLQLESSIDLQQQVTLLDNNLQAVLDKQNQMQMPLPAPYSPNSLHMHVSLPELVPQSYSPVSSVSVWPQPSIPSCGFKPSFPQPVLASSPWFPNYMPSKEDKRSARHARRKTRASQQAQRAAIGIGITSSPDLPIPYNTFTHIQNHLLPGSNFTHHYVNGNVMNSSRDDSFRISGSGNNINISFTPWISDSGFGPFIPESHCDDTAGPPIFEHVLPFDQRASNITSISQHMHQWRKMGWLKILMRMQASKYVIAVSWLYGDLWVISSLYVIDLGMINSLATTRTLGKGYIKTSDMLHKPTVTHSWFDSHQSSSSYFHEGRKRRSIELTLQQSHMSIYYSCSKRSNKELDATSGVNIKNKENNL